VTVIQRQTAGISSVN